MKNTRLLILLLLGITSTILSQQNFNPDQRITELVGDKQNVGVAAGYAVAGETKWSNSAGYLCKEDQKPFTPTSLTRIASISKCFTAVAIMQLVEQGLLELDAPIGSYLADLPEDKNQISTRQLLAHTSGIPQYKDQKEIENSTHYTSLQEAMNVFIDRPLLFEPGTKFFYSSYGYVVLGRIIESVTSTTYADYMKKHVFDMADLKNTGVENINKTYPNKSCLYHHNGRKPKEGKQNDLSNRIPGGGFYSTLEDLIKFGNALVERNLIKQESLDTMLQMQAVVYEGNKYGLGWYFYGPAPNENLVIGHGGGQTGCTSQLMIIPKTKTVVVVLSNTSRTYQDIVTFASNLIGYSEKE